VQEGSPTNPAGGTWPASAPRPARPATPPPGLGLFTSDAQSGLDLLVKPLGAAAMTLTKEISPARLTTTVVNRLRHHQDEGGRLVFLSSQGSHQTANQRTGHRLQAHGRQPHGIKEGQVFVRRGPLRAEQDDSCRV